MKKPWIFAAAFGLQFAVVYHAAAATPLFKPTLNDIPPAWSDTLQCDRHACPRFEVVMGDAAVLDHETGLVWEKSPLTTAVPWYWASYSCALLELGGRSGWHLPTVEQLASLGDRSVVPGSPVALPLGHPFLGVQSAGYWTSSTLPKGIVPPDVDGVYYVSFGGGDVGGAYVSYNNAYNYDYRWCVRGG